ncbi:MAG: Carboxy-terminal processing protease CtpA [Anaerolineae bacterium]|nr:Carboxy-terminal processing protease CtpA [Anaerolineae bacterium]
MKRLLSILLVTIGLFGLTSLAFGAGIFVGQSDLFGPAVVRAQDQPPEFDVFWEVWALAKAHFIDRTVMNDPKRLAYGAINGFIEALGDEGHTRFVTPEEVARQKENISGSFFGIGAQVGMQDGMPVIVAPFDGSPAEAAGVKAGDIIIEVDGQDVTGLTLTETVDRIRGEKGTTVVLTLYRPDSNESKEISIVRDEIKIPAASWGMIPGTKVALIRLSQFNGNLDDNLRQIVTETKAAGATAYILDVRNNPGGLLEQAIKVSSEFLKSGNVLLQEDANGKRESYPVEKGGVATDIPVVVLVNRGSASSSEIFAGAIQDQNRGKVVGETTFGTGTVLRPFDLSDGSTLLLGTSQWLTPNGRLIRKHGIEPDVTVELPIGTNLIAPGGLKDMTRADVLNSEDKQLLKALELLGELPENKVTEQQQPAAETIK